MDTPAAEAIADEKAKETVEATPEAEKVEVVNASDDPAKDGPPPRPEFSLRPTLFIIGAAIIGLILGISLSYSKESDKKLVAISWVKLPGDLFIRALKCVVLPLVFVNIILAVVDMIRAGKASAVGWKTIGLYTLTTVLAAVEGLIFILMFQKGFDVQHTSKTDTPAAIAISCPHGGFLSEGDNITGVECVDNAEEGTKFVLDNTHGTFVNVDSGGVEDDISFSQTLQDGIFRKLVSDNIVNEFIKANFVGVIMFAIIFAASSQSLVKQPKVVIELLEEINRIFLLGIDWIIYLTPIAIVSLIGGNLGAQKDLASVFSNIGLLMAATLLAMAFHFFVTYPVLFVYFVRQNPFSYYRFLIPAQLFAFASASSAATLPISLDCVAASGQVPNSVRNFVLSMGATLNMDGGGIYFPTAIVFLAVSSGIEDKLNASTYFLIILLSTLGSAGTAPVPSASLVLIITAYNTVFDTTGTPDAFGLILAVDWLMDRFRTTLNVTGDTVMARIVTAIAHVSMDDDTLENEAVAGEGI